MKRAKQRKGAEKGSPERREIAGESGNEPAEHVDLLLGVPTSRNIYRTARNLTHAIAWCLFAAFAWLEFNGIPLLPVAKSISAGVVLKAAVAVYYGCWVAGLLGDTTTQQRVYAIQPNKGRMPSSGYLSALALSGIFAALCWWVDTYTRFAVFLTVFLAVNVMTWQYLVRRFLPKTVAESEKVYQGKWARLAALECFYWRYLRGRWQWWRFAAGGGILLIINLMAFTGLASVVAGWTGWMSPELVMALTILVFVLFMEAWIWWVRLRLRATLDVLEHLERSYTGSLTKRPA